MTFLQFVIGLAAVSVALSLFMSVAWLIQQRTGNSGWIDTTWTFSLGLVGLGCTFAASAPSHARATIVAVFAVVWSVRLGLHIAQRSAGITDDPRYVKLIREWGRDARWQMFWLCQKQALVSIPMAMGFYLAAHNPLPGLRAQDWLAVAVMVIAVSGEALADGQLKKFKSNPANRGKINDIGLWNWSRHPNYFFEWFGWMAFPLLAIDAGGSYPWGWFAVAAPACMYWALVYVCRAFRRLRSTCSRPVATTSSLINGAPMRSFPRRRETTGDAMSMIEFALPIVERLPWPDTISKTGVAYLVSRTSRKLARTRSDATPIFAKAMSNYPLAEHTQDANAQHYEIPAAFFDLVLGPARKYSCCYYDRETMSLAEAEELALSKTADNAGLADGQNILELGCGWGALSLWMASHFPNASINAVSNSHSQRKFIMGEAGARGLPNLTVITADMNTFMTTQRFDRVVSVEMFEHMANWRLLLERVQGWLNPDGRLFFHVFTHRQAPYRFDHRDKSDWIAQHFFTGGIMPSHALIREFPELFALEAEWKWSGTHYARTALDWLDNFDRNNDAIGDVLRQTYGPDAALWRRRWRLFFLATAGLFGHADGSEWGISHYRLTPV
jgi:cyclopropane-fatty-acyl-phospholipid synthase